MDGPDSPFIGQGGWSAYEKLVMAQLKTQAERLDHIDENIVLLRIDVAKLKVKAGIWGAVAGAVPGFALGIIPLLAQIGGGGG